MTHNVHGEGDALQEGQFDVPHEIAPVEQLIGTDMCSYCGTQSECLSLPDDGTKPRGACYSCIQKAFVEYWGGHHASVD